MGISDHWGEPRTFSSDCLFTETKKHSKCYNFLNFLRDIKDQFFSQFDVLINDFTLSPLNGVSSRVFFDHIDK